MPATLRQRPRIPLLLAALALVLLVGAAAFYRLMAPSLIAERIRHAAASRGLTASWRALALRPPVRIAVRDLLGVDARGDTAVRVASLDVDIDPVSLFARPPRIVRLGVDSAHVTLLPPAGGAADDTLDAEAADRGRLRHDHLPRLRRTADAVVRGLLRATHGLPRVSLRDITVSSRDPEVGDQPVVRIADLEVRSDRASEGGALEGSGVVWLENAVPFSARLTRGREGNLEGRLDLDVGGSGGPETLSIALLGRVERAGHPRGVRLAEGSRLDVGNVPLAISGLVESAGPHVAASITARDVRPDDLRRSIPSGLLGPLAGLPMRGAFDYALSFDLDLARPDSLELSAAVVSHDLELVPTGDRLGLLGLDQPFMAAIHLPRGRVVYRAVSRDNPHFRTLETIDSTLVLAVVTNEDGGFFRHRGFNVEAMKQALVENLHAGTYRRGAGTITMQLVRNLYLGHERTLARKGQEVVLTWIVEHLTGLSKRRLLEIYFNIIEWGPDVHGADEAASYYFGQGADSMSVSEALFLATIVPAPTKWRFRFDPSGALRPFARKQMHFIGRAMVAKGWLDATRLPPTDSLDVTLLGPARDVLFPPADSTGAAPADTAASRPETLSDAPPQAY